VSLFLGTQLVGTVNGALQTGPSGNNNLLSILQLSGATAGRQSRVGEISVGATQLPDRMVVCSQMVTMPSSPSAGHVWLLAENTSANLAENTNLKAYIAKETDPSSNWTQITLSNEGVFGGGILDPWKDMIALKGSASFASGSGTSLRMCVETPSGVFLPIKAMGLRVDYP
jgi:hypothetical protein